ncbi:MAG: hypothetical protein JXQ96_11920 [Cyclobacteriaceae bacterium]
MKTFSRLVVFIVISLIIQSYLARMYHGLMDAAQGCDEYSIELDSASTVALHQRFWKDNYHSGRYCMDYSYRSESYIRSEAYRNELKLPRGETYDQFWGAIYNSLYQNDSAELKHLADSLREIRLEKNLNSTEFAHMVVKFVQDIPYSYIISEPCGEMKDGKPCKGDSRFGILSPIEFLYTLKGDCDTRTVLLYGLLKDFGYDALILISNEYLHSMLAVNIPGTGDYISHKGKKFYFWETTNTGWEPGMIAPDMQNTNYWDLALDYDI